MRMTVTPDAHRLTRYERELAKLKDWDEVQETVPVNDMDFIITAGHGYLVVPKSHPRYKEARAICTFGFKGTLAVYLEEDCEARAFLNDTL
jgi:hypothetical protein